MTCYNCQKFSTIEATKRFFIHGTLYKLPVVKSAFESGNILPGPTFYLFILIALELKN